MGNKREIKSGPVYLTASESFKLLSMAHSLMINTGTERFMIDFEKVGDGAEIECRAYIWLEQNGNMHTVGCTFPTPRGAVEGLWDILGSGNAPSITRLEKLPPFD